MSKKNVMQQFNIDFFSGIVTGIVCTGVLSPWDKALYLSVLYNRPFLSRSNFTSPYKGVSQAIAQRAFLGSIYYILQGEMKYHLQPYLQQTLGFKELPTQFYIGLVCGSMNGLLTSSVSTIKYHTWTHENRSFLSSIREMYTLGGYKTFLKGTLATAGRDAVFGSIYEVMRTLFKNQTKTQNTAIDFFSNTCAAGIATIASGPLNYARTIQYSTHPNLKAPKISTILKKVWSESKNQRSPIGQLLFFQQRFTVGFGTARVAVGMGMGQHVFDYVRSHLNESAPLAEKASTKSSGSGTPKL